MKDLVLLSAFCFQLAFGQTISTPLTYSVNLPAERSPETPVLIMLHGYGSNEGDLFDLAKAFDEKLITFSLRAPYPTAAGGFAWFDLQQGSDGQRKYNYAQVAESRSMVLSFIANACKAYNVDSTRVFLLGFSQGAIMSYEISFAAPGKIAGILALSGRMLPETKEHGTNLAALQKQRIFIAHGKSDNVIRLPEAEDAAGFLRSKNIRHTYKTYEMPHSINGAELNDIKMWLAGAITREKEPAKKSAPQK